MSEKRMQPKERREAILAAAIKLSRAEGYNRITREGVANAAGGISPGLVSQYFNTMAQLRRALIRHAINANPPVLEIIAQGLAAKDPHALKASDALKRQAADLLLS